MKCILIDAQNPQWVDAEQTAIVIQAKWEHLENEGYLSFLATSNDPEEHGVDLYNRIINGEFGTIAEYVAPVEEQPSE